jgi:hypothetical protein
VRSCKTVFDIGAVIPGLQVRELTFRSAAERKRRAKDELTVKKFAGRCSSAQKRRGVSRVIE